MRASRFVPCAFLRGSGFRAGGASCDNRADLRTPHKDYSSGSHAVKLRAAETSARSPMNITILGAGAMGSLCGALLAEAGDPAVLVDVRREQVEATGLKSWQWLFLIEGAPAIVLGIIVWAI